jgi:nucleoside-diphosphate-sugar epimerase
MRILITGASGFIGNHLSSKLQDEHEIYTIIRNSENTNFNSSFDLADELHDKFDHICVDAIIHCASVFSDHKTSNDIRIFKDNLKITENIAKIVKIVKAKTLINFSSIAVYARQSGTFDENSTIRPSDSPEGIYGLSKFCSEELFKILLAGNECRLVNLRLGQTYGEGMRSDRIFSLMIESIEEENTIRLWSEGSRESGFLSIGFLIKSLEKILDNQKIDAGTYNLVEENLSYKEIAERIKKKYGNPKTKIESVDKGAQPKMHINNDKLISTLSL